MIFAGIRIPEGSHKLGATNHRMQPRSEVLQGWNETVREARRFRIKRNISQSDQTGNSFLLIRPGVVVVLHNLSFRLNKTMIFRETH